MTTELEAALWSALVLEGNFHLIELLAKAQRQEPGYSVVIVPKRKGFSNSDWVHNHVLRWLKENEIPFLDVSFEVGNLQLALNKGKKMVKKMRKVYGLIS